MKTKIIATIGPKSLSINTIKNMKNNGLDIARINTKYSNKSQWEHVIKILHKLKIEVMIDIKSLKHLNWVNSQKIDYLAISYAENSSQIKNIINKLNNKSVKIISKIENKKGLNNLDNLIKISDGVMVARGDLSRNVAFEKVPYYKKIIIDKCNAKKRFVIVATEMLLSMVKSKRPTNAEVDDVFSSVIEGGNGLMLSEETAVGNHPSLAVKTMKKIILNAEKYLNN